MVIALRLCVVVALGLVIGGSVLVATAGDAQDSLDGRPWQDFFEVVPDGGDQGGKKRWAGSRSTDRAALNELDSSRLRLHHRVCHTWPALNAHPPPRSCAATDADASLASPPAATP